MFAAKSSVLGDTQHASSFARIQQLEAPKHVRASDADAPKQAPEFVRPLNDVGLVAEGGKVHLECQLMPTDDPQLTVALQNLLVM
jgi:hypothetical protein